MIAHLLQRGLSEPVLDLSEYDITRLQQEMQAGALSSRQITQWSLNRIAAIDDAGPMLNAVIATNPDALAIADERDAERRAGKVRGPLHGIPVLLKDNIDTGDRQPTTAGSLALAGAPAAQDAEVTRRLRDAGAIILGKTNLSEWANIRSTHSSSGWSAVGGMTRNPHVLDRTACGSSSGSGVAVAAGLVDLRGQCPPGLCEPDRHRRMPGGEVGCQSFESLGAAGQVAQQQPGRGAGCRRQQQS